MNLKEAKPKQVEVFRWISSEMLEYVLNNVGLYPRFSDRIKRLNIGDLLIDFYDKDDLDDRISDDLGDDIDLDKYTAQVVEGSRDGMLRWAHQNLRRICWKEGASSAAFAVVHAGEKGIQFLFIMNGGDLPKSEIISELRDMGYSVDSSAVWTFDCDADYDDLNAVQRAGLGDFFTALKAWRDVEIFDVEELEEKTL
jgi:hypothetical protein